MNELFLMKAIGDIPDDLVKCYFDESTASTHAAMSSDSLNRNAADRVGAAQESKMPQKKIVMKKNQARKESSSIHFSRAGIAAVVAVCIGLNAALIYGIGRLKAPDNMAAFSENEMQLHIELVDAMPTGVAVTYQNRSENTYELPLSAEIWQNGKKVESISIVSDLSKIGVTKFPPLEPDQSFDMLYSFDELPHDSRQAKSRRGAFIRRRKACRDQRNAEKDHRYRKDIDEACFRYGERQRYEIA